MEIVESLRDLISLPVFYLGIVLCGMLIQLVCMPLVNYHAFGWLYGRDRDRGWNIADRIIRIQKITAVVMAIAGAIFVIGLFISKSHFLPFF